MHHINKLLPKIFLYFIYLLLFVITCQFPFFWDTIQLASAHAHYFFETDFQSIILPNELDSGHIPFLGFYLGIIWKVFGKTLFVSHLAMLPFIMGIVYQSLLLTKSLFKERWQFKAALLLVCDATLLAQSTMVSPDVLLVFSFLTAMNCLIAGKRKLLSVAFLGLALSSMRGMMCVAAYFLMEVTLLMADDPMKVSKYYFIQMFKKVLHLLKAYYLCIIVASAFLFWHYMKTGWIGYHKTMPWYPLFQPVGLQGIIRNIGILGWRLMDFGRLFMWISGLLCFIHFIRNKPLITRNLRSLLILTVCTFLALAHAVIFHKNLSGHRYLIPIYLMFSLSVSYYVFEVSNRERWKKFFFWFVLLGSLTGNLWVYPDRIAKGWDSTLGYLPYFHLRSEMISFMKENKISFDKTGTGFPNNGSFEFTDLSGSTLTFDTINLSKNHYVFYSNVYNDFDDQQLNELKQKWQIIKEVHIFPVRVTLYKNPKDPSNE